MQGKVKIKGLDEALNAMQAAFPKDPKKQKSLLNSAMRESAKGMLETAKQLAKTGDASGALSESLGIRAMSKKKLQTTRTVAGVEIAPIRSNRKAMALYIQHYYTAKGRTAPTAMITSGIRHGHLVEFGSVNNPARPFLYPAGKSNQSQYINSVSENLSKKTEAAVRRARKR